MTITLSKISNIKNDCLEANPWSLGNKTIALIILWQTLLLKLLILSKFRWKFTKGIFAEVISESVQLLLTYESNRLDLQTPQVTIPTAINTTLEIVEFVIQRIWGTGKGQDTFKHWLMLDWKDLKQT